MALFRALKEKDSVSSVASSVKVDTSVCAKRRQFVENRSKSAIEIATDYLFQVQSQARKKDGRDKLTALTDNLTVHDGDNSPVVSSNSTCTACSDEKQAEADFPTCKTPARFKALFRAYTVDSKSGAEHVQEAFGKRCTETEESVFRHKLIPPADCSCISSLTLPEAESCKETSQQPRSSWRKGIFERVCTTAAFDSSIYILAPEAEGGSNTRRGRKVSVARSRWKTAMLETLLQLRLEKDNSDDIEKEFSLEQKLGYVQLSPCTSEASQAWENLLQAATTGYPCTVSSSTLLHCVRNGVPRSMRGLIWKLLAVQQSNHSNVDSYVAGMFEVPYQDLLEQQSNDQHAILIDLGRTFPGHPYFAKSLGTGQLKLFNVLKAYCLLDKEVGYCQGVSFITGLLLMHMEEVAAFEMIRHLMLNLGLRKQYCPDMIDLQLKLYQLVRLIHDHEKEVFDHMEQYEVAPAMYATPWFLTLFASQFPLAFVARVFDLLFIQGPEVIFKVALRLIRCHRELILLYNSFEELVEFLKTGLPEMAHVQLERVLDQTCDMDISLDLQTYQVEFHVFREEMLCASQTETIVKKSTVTTLQNTVLRLRHQNHELTEALQNMESQIRTLQMAVSQFRLNEDKLKAGFQTLELERSALLIAVANLKTKESGNESVSEGKE